MYFGWLEGESKGGKENATILNGFFKGRVESEAYVCLVVGEGLGEWVKVVWIACQWELS